MPMLKDPSKKYRPFPILDLPDRQWPTKRITKAPRWLETSLRDGNQSNPDPMNGEEKRRFFKMLCDIGFKEIEVSFPSASPTDFNFTRKLVETPGAIPDDVAIQVLSPCRPELIKRTVEAVSGAKNAIIHIYLATSECFRRLVFNHSEEDTLALAVSCTKYVRSITKEDPSQSATNWQFEFSPECFSDTDPDFAVKVCNAVREAWGPTKEVPMIVNLPATVEVASCNVFADQVEYFCRNIQERETICVSVHNHNDRGTAAASAELAQMAGADRVEGCIFGNGERTGNVCLTTLSLNLYSQGIPCGLDFSDMNGVIDVVEECNRLPVHPRHPYAGSLVVCAFSGSHQNAINRGFETRQREGKARDDYWEIPYLPIDPEDIGRTYEAVIRVNSQSGKGGAAWVIRHKLNLDLPRGLQIAFSNLVQEQADSLGRELQPQEIADLFETTYSLRDNPRFSLVDYTIAPDRSRSPVPPAPGRTQDTKNLRRTFEGVILVDNSQEIKLRGRGNGPISSMANALKDLGVDLDVNDYKEHAIGEGRGVKAASYIECIIGGTKQTVWGVGIHEDVVQSSLIAMLSAASNFVTSRPSSPIVRPQAARPAKAGSNGVNGAFAEASRVVSALEDKANGM